MMLSLSIGQGLSSHSQGGNNVLSDIVRNLYLFYDGGEDAKMVLRDPVHADKEVAAGEYFKTSGYRHEVVQDSLPADVDVKGGYIPRKGRYAGKPCLELSAIDFKALEQRLQDEHVPVVVKGRGVYDEMGNQLLQTKTMLYNYKGRETRRSNVVCLPAFNAEEQMNLVLHVIDTIYNQAPYDRDDYLEEQISYGVIPRGQGLRQEMNLSLKQILDTEQVILTGMRMQVIPSLVLRAQVLQMPTQDLIRKTEETQEELDAITEASYQEARRKGIARIKQVSKEPLTWRQAEILYNRLIKKQIHFGRK